MEISIPEFSDYLDTIENNSEPDTSLGSRFTSLDSILSFLSENIKDSMHLKVLRQLLFHCEAKVIELFIFSPNLLIDIIDWINLNRVNYDSTKLIVELYDESSHSEIVTKELINHLVDGLGESDKRTCENIVKILILIGNCHLDKVIEARNSRFFGELLVLRVNWAQGTEKKNLIRTISRIFKSFPNFFYLNDLKLIVDTLIKVLNDREDDLIEQTYEALQEIMKIDEFLDTRYRFDELAEILQHGEDQIELCEIQNALLDTINKI